MKVGLEVVSFGFAGRLGGDLRLSGLVHVTVLVLLLLYEMCRTGTLLNLVTQRKGVYLVHYMMRGERLVPDYM